MALVAGRYVPDTRFYGTRQRHHAMAPWTGFVSLFE